MDVQVFYRVYLPQSAVLQPLFLFTPSPSSRVYNSKKGGGGSLGPVRDIDYTCSIELASDVVLIPVKGRQ
jgi:hypothetical protein